jgi:hypothetical protein
MNNLNQTGKWLVAGVVAVIVIVVLVLYGGGQNPSGPVNTSSTPSGTTGAIVADNGTPPTVGNPAGGNTAPVVNKNPGTGTAPQQAPIVFITPVPGETWTIGTQNPVQWSREGGVSGQIELLDATTLKLVGVILNQIAPHQTSYTWNTRDILLSRTNPLKTTVVPGRYVVKISFDGNNLPPITSQPITLAK